MPVLNFLLVGAGGALGAMARYGVAIGLPLHASGFPAATLVVNVLGGLLMGVLAGSLLRLAPEAAEGWRLFLGVGILGGFTTFSAFSLETVRLIERGAVPLAALYVGLSLVLSVAALAVGLVLSKALA